MEHARTPETRCLYCGKNYPLGAEQCPHCAAPAHRRPQRRLRRFRWLVIAIAVACLVLILWLPR